MNYLPGIVLQSAVDYSKGTGYGSIILEADGTAALDLLQKKLLTGTNINPEIDGDVTIKVLDKSLGGYSREFKVHFSFISKIVQQYDSESG